MRRVSWNSLICGTLRGRPRIRWRVNVYEEVGAFYEGYRGEKRIIGASREGRNLYAMYVGTSEGVRGGAAAGIATYAIHAREWITSYLALQHLRRGIVRGGVWVVPLVNPDGALLVQEGADSVRPSLRGGLLYLNGGADFSLWKANARAVDLNVNFDAGWGTGRQNVRAPAPANYIGTAPFSEPETQALRDFTLEVTPSFTVSYHTKGEVIYWRYRQSALRAARHAAKQRAGFGNQRAVVVYAHVIQLARADHRAADARIRHQHIGAIAQQQKPDAALAEHAQGF